MQASLADDAVPIDRHFGVAAEDVGGEDLLGDLILRGIDDLGLRHDGGDLLQMTGLGDVTENDAHGGRWRWSLEENRLLSAFQMRWQGDIRQEIPPRECGCTNR